MSSNNESQNPAFLIRRAASGDSNAFEQIYEMYLTPVFRFVFCKVKHKETAEDITQVVFMKVFENLERYEDRGNSPLAYFFTVAKNQIIDFWRKKKEALPDDPHLFFSQRRDEKNDTRKIVEEKLEKESFFELIDELPELQRDALLLRFMEDLTSKEVAALLGKSESAIRKAQSRGLQKLRAKF